MRLNRGSMRLDRWWILGAVLSLLPMLVVADARDDAATIRWDLIHIVTFSPSGNVIAEGGKASASAQNKSTITLTGSGTFTLGDSDDVTGGGTWQTVAPPPDLPGNPPPGPAGSPDTLFEGITASKGFVDYWNRAAPVPNVDGNRTLFHVLPTNED
jgi:hypothetical protein